MTARREPQEHHHPDEDTTGFDWFRVLDLAVWVCVFVITGLCIEWLIGSLARESVASGADRFLAKLTPTMGEAPAGE